MPESPVPVAPASTAAATAIAAPKSKIVSSDITPPQFTTHKIVVPAAASPEVLKAIDPNYQAGDLAAQINAVADQSGQITFIIHYKKAA